MKAILLRVVRAPVTARTWREYAYAVAALVFAVPAFLLALLGVVSSAGTLVIAGLPVLAAVLVTARPMVAWFRTPARAILGWDWPSQPLLPRGQGPAGGWSRCSATVSRGARCCTRSPGSR